MAETETKEKTEKKTEEKGKNTAGIQGKAEEFLQWIEGITVLELSRLVKALEERLGVTASAPVTVAAGGAAQASASKEEAKTDFTVVLASAGEQKIAVIKEIRVITGLGLKDSKDLVEGAPKTIKEGVSKEDAAQIKSKLEAVGAVVEIK